MKFVVGRDGVVVNIVNPSPAGASEDVYWLVDDATVINVGDVFDDKARQVDDVAQAILQVLFRHENLLRQVIRSIRTNAGINTASNNNGLPTSANSPDLTLPQAKTAFKNLIP